MQCSPSYTSATPRLNCLSLSETEVGIIYFAVVRINPQSNLTGLLVYYLQRGDADALNGGPGLKAFPEGFKMISGNPRSRSKKYICATHSLGHPIDGFVARYATQTGTQDELRERATEWSCLRYPNADGYNGYGFPTTDCEAGFQARLHMPSCWDGKVRWRIVVLVSA